MEEATFGEIRPNNIASTSGSNAMTIASGGQVTFATNPILGSGQILEIVSSVCDGSTVNGYTFQSISASQELQHLVEVLLSSSISYTPGTTQVVYEFNYHEGFQDNHAIKAIKIFIDSDEVVYGRHTYGHIDNFHERLTFKWVINIGGSADTNVGRLASWSGAT